MGKGGAVNAIDFLALSPLLALAAGVTGTLLTLAVGCSRRVVFRVAITALAIALGLMAPAWSVAPHSIQPLFVMDGLGLFFTMLILAGALAVMVLSADYFRGVPGPAGEYACLLLIAALGGCVVSTAAHMASLFLGMELIGIPLYALIAYRRDDRNGLEAGIKYLVLAGMGSALLLMGLALLYAATGSLQISGLFSSGADAEPVWMYGGLALTLAGLAFKLALAPLHMWTADVYQGAPMPVTAFIATVAKGSVLAFLLRYLTLSAGGAELAAGALTFLAALSMTAGNLLALRQTNLKRMLAYSSIAHLGYLMIVVPAAPPLATASAGFYLVAYFAAMLAAFGALGMLSSPEAEAQNLADLRGLAWRRPGLAGVLIVAMLSLAGIPPTAGFFGKLYVLLAGVDSGQWLLVVVLVVNSVIGLCYYLRLIPVILAGRAMARPARDFSSAWGSAAVLIVLTLLLIVLGLYPGPLMAWLSRLAGLGPG